jgi:hypothetical protein
MFYVAGGFGRSVGYSRPERNPLGAPGRSLKGIGKVLRLARHFSISEFHDTHGKGTLIAVINHVLANPEVAFTHDPPDAKSRWLARVVATQRLQIVATANYLALLWVLAHNVIVVDVVFGNLVTRGRGSPMPIYGSASLFFHN